MAGGADASGPVHLHPDVVAVPCRGLPDMEAHPDSYVHSLRPRRPGQGELRLGGSRQCFQWAGEYDEKGIALGSDLGPSVPFEGLPKEEAVPVEGVLIGAGEPLGEAGRAFDVGEEEGMKLGRARRHWWKIGAAAMSSADGTERSVSRF